jgi:hypothetical protein
MKNLFFWFAIIITANSYGQTSIYHPFPDSNASWNYSFNQYMCAFGDAWEEYSYLLNGDTTINGQTYHKLSTPFVSFFTQGSCTQEHFPGYKGAIRQDIPNRKVYYVHPSSSSEALLYDFNLAIGDTIHGYLASNAGMLDTVISMDSVLVGNDFRKRWLINDWYEIYYIEGIGSTYGLLENSPGYVTDAPGYYFDCFKQDQQTLYPDTNTNCQLITSAHDISILEEPLKIFPNPSKGSFSIEFKQPKDIKGISLLSLVGNVILSAEIHDQTSICLNNIPCGIYILAILDKNNRTTNKKIISCP